MKFKVYNSILLCSVVILLSVILWFALYLEPLDGDLTRIGNYKESDYGYNSPLEAFESDLSEFAESPKDYGTYRDVVVVGDSFSDQRGRRFGWQNFFIKGTGLSLITFYHGVKTNTLEDLIKTEGFLKHPPRILIYESIERGLYSLISRSRYQGQCKAQPELLLNDPVLIRALNIRTAMQARNKGTLLDAPLWDFSLKSFEYSLLYVSLALKTTFTPGGGTSVDELPLRNPHLFSNRKADSILILKDDYKKYTFGSSQLQSIACGLFNLQSIVEKNGKTKLIIMLAPDKTTAYADFILSNKVKHDGIIPNIPGISKMPLPRIDLALKEAITTGEADVYLPNDTHWGPRGNKIAANCLVNYLLEKNIFKR